MESNWLVAMASIHDMMTQTLEQRAVRYIPVVAIGVVTIASTSSDCAPLSIIMICIQGLKPS